MSANLMENSSNNKIRQSTECLRSSSGSVWRISRRLKRHGETADRLGNQQNFLLLSKISQTDAEVQGNLLREYEQKFAQLPQREKLTKLCSDAEFSKNIEKGQYFICTWWWYTSQFRRIMSRVYFTSKWWIIPRERWIRGNTTIGPVLDVRVCYHQGRFGVEIMIESAIRDRTISWVRIVNGINKYETETSEEILVASVGDRSAGKPVAKAWPRPTPTLTLSYVSLPHRN